MRLELALDPTPKVFEEENSGGPYPYLTNVGALRLTARAGESTGIAGTESASVPVTFNNRGRKASKIIGRPLRIHADIYDDDGELYFSGIVSHIEYGAQLIVEIGA